MTIIIILLLSSLFSITNASTFTDGFAIGYILTDIQNKVLHDESPIKVKQNYYNFTRDTSFQTFPIDYSPQCVPEKYLIVPIYHTPTENFIMLFIYLIVISPTLCICYCSDDEERERLCGIYMGVCTRNMFDDR